MLYAGAKSEGTVTWYTSLAGDSYKALARAFEAKYPGVRVESYRAGGSELVVRMTEETKARRPTFDALETTYDFMMVSRADNLTRPYNSPILASYPAEAKEKADKGLTFWTIFRESYMGFGYNKEPSPCRRGAQRIRRLAPSTAQRQNGNHAQRKLSPHDRRDA